MQVTIIVFIVIDRWRYPIAVVHQLFTDELTVTRNTFIARVCYRFYDDRHRQGGTRCGSLRSTSLAADLFTRCTPGGRCSAWARAVSAGVHRSCSRPAWPDHTRWRLFCLPPSPSPAPSAVRHAPTC